jgi:hypothetical protein|tara:strand:- start:74 stop:280 length:207 start_codon:yes stop_codon:yes gene_type:complete
MNDKQKIFLIVGIITFIIWLFLPTSKVVGIDWLFDSDTTYRWFRDWDNVLLFALWVGSGVAFFLFKDK